MLRRFCRSWLRSSLRIACNAQGSPSQSAPITCNWVPSFAAQPRSSSRRSAHCHSLRLITSRRAHSFMRIAFRRKDKSRSSAVQQAVRADRQQSVACWSPRRWRGGGTTSALGIRNGFAKHEIIHWWRPHRRDECHLASCAPYRENRQTYFPLLSKVRTDTGRRYLRALRIGAAVVQWSTVSPHSRLPVATDLPMRRKKTRARDTQEGWL